MAFSFRPSLLLFALLLISACTTVRPDDTAAPPPAADAHLGVWSFEATDGTRTVAGTFDIGPEASRMIITGFVVDPAIRNETRSLDGTSLRWSGDVLTVMGMRRFSIEATTAGDTLRGTNELQGLGVYDFVAVRAR